MTGCAGALQQSAARLGRRCCRHPRQAHGAATWRSVCAEHEGWGRLRARAAARRQKVEKRCQNHGYCVPLPSCAGLPGRAPGRCSTRWLRGVRHLCGHQLCTKSAPRQPPSRLSYANSHRACDENDPRWHTHRRSTEVCSWIALHAYGCGVCNRELGDVAECQVPQLNITWNEAISRQTAGSRVCGGKRCVASTRRPLTVRRCTTANIIVSTPNYVVKEMAMGVKFIRR